MKTRLLIPLFAVCSSAVLLAQTADNTKSSPSGPPGDPGKNGAWRDKMRDKMLEHLPPELRKRFEAARDKAMQDPAIQELKKKADAAGEDFRTAMRDAMIKADPGLAEMLKERMDDKGRSGNKDGRHIESPGFTNLSENDRQKLMAAREKAKDDPAVQAADAKRKDAKTPEQRQAAMEEFHKVMKDALLKADPTIGPILDQLKPPQGAPPTAGSGTGPSA